MRALVSIHDVMPETLGRVADLIQRIPPAARAGLVLLVVPGRDWQPRDIEQLALWQQQGLELAGHGWHHRAGRIAGLYHRWHARFISRQAAEHLSLSRRALRQLLVDNHAWFEHHRLTPPELYVPPAWALGPLHRQDLAASPFRYFETTSGLYQVTGAAKVVRWHLPLLGFEADTAGRQCGLRLWNRANRALASERRPLRLALHPYDGELLLARDLSRALAELTECLDYRTLFDRAPARPIRERTG
ncbi:polysaccharide deacetylase family protein [Marinimicrobium sp. C2-29]|uniref:polysaccharide deacetylase family protein n=1 Tax=Marinimicrobium sp. C2-29 TaxID=3139825 RepID=UPI003139F386